MTNFPQYKLLAAKVIATGFGSGFSPLAPGTAGALLACLMLWAGHFCLPAVFFGETGQAVLFLFILVFFFAGVWAANVLETAWGHDPSRIVVDEMVGVWVAMLFVPFTPVNLAIAFVLFRIFDIWKPLGIRRMERLPGGWGVMMDDVVAGVYACLLVHLMGIITGK